jgi:hypothetical protein
VKELVFDQPIGAGQATHPMRNLTKLRGARAITLAT